MTEANNIRLLRPSSRIVLDDGSTTDILSNPTGRPLGAHPASLLAHPQSSAERPQQGAGWAGRFAEVLGWSRRPAENLPRPINRTGRARYSPVGVRC
jgi:hypothetical protein